VLVCGAAGGAFAARTGAVQRVRLAQMLAGALGGAFFGGLLVEVVLFRLALEVTGGDMILQRAPGVLLFGLLGAWGAAARTRTSTGKEVVQEQTISAGMVSDAEFRKAETGGTGDEGGMY